MNVLEHYRRLRSDSQGCCGRASYCLATAKRYAAIDRIWDDAETAGLVRLRIEPDDTSEYDDLAGECYDVAYNADSVPGGARTIQAQEKAFRCRIDRDGVWGYTAEYWTGCDVCGRGEWEHAYSCWGFIGEVCEDAVYDGKYEALVAAGLIE
jgi:hypothetical protein